MNNDIGRVCLAATMGVNSLHGVRQDPPDIFLLISAISSRIYSSSASIFCGLFSKTRALIWPMETSLLGLSLRSQFRSPGREKTRSWNFPHNKCIVVSYQEEENRFRIIASKMHRVTGRVAGNAIILQSKSINTIHKSQYQMIKMISINLPTNQKQ